MLNSFPISALIGIVLGFLSGLGVGGGSLLILWLTAVVGMEYPLARTINLLFFIPAAIISLFIRGKNGNIPWKTIIPAIQFGLQGVESEFLQLLKVCL